MLRKLYLMERQRLFTTGYLVLEFKLPYYVFGSDNEFAVI